MTVAFPTDDELGEVHSRGPGMTVREIKAADFDREQFRAASVAAAHAAIDALPGHLDRIRAMLRTCFLPHILAIISNWSMVRRVGADGAAIDSVIAGLEQHHVELRQALLLTMKRREP
jgi:hypothetical protein